MKQPTTAGHCSKLIGIGATLWSAICLPAQSPTFSLKVLGEGYVYGINDVGEAVGSLNGGSSSCPNGCAVIWQNGTPTLLGAVTGEIGGTATAINNAGQVAGSVVMANETDQAVVWNNGTPTLLPAPGPQYIATTAAAINDGGEVAGSAAASDVGTSGLVAVVWVDLTPTVLSPVSGFAGGTLASGINRNGVVVGANYVNDSGAGAVEAVVWHGTTATLLPLITYSQGSPAGKALAINNSGLAVGIASASAGELAAAWADGVGTSLGTLDTGHRSTATAANNLGIIVGQSDTVGTDLNHAALWSHIGSAPQDLNSLISVGAALIYTLTGATGINDSCAIVANGYNKKTGAKEAFLLTLIDASSCVNGFSKT
jgi:uncharacterized membrane protein